MKNGKSQMKKGILMLMVLAMIGCTLAFASAESAVVDDANHTEAVEQDRSDSDLENVNNSILNSLLPPDIGAQDSEDIDERRTMTQRMKTRKTRKMKMTAMKMMTIAIKKISPRNQMTA